METLIGPLRSGDTVLPTAYEQLFQSRELHLMPISQGVLREGARLRATVPALRTPDAVHAATGTIVGCTMFLSNDVGFRRVPGLPLVILDEVVAAP